MFPLQDSSSHTPISTLQITTFCDTSLPSDSTEPTSNTTPHPPPTSLPTSSHTSQPCNLCMHDEPIAPSSYSTDETESPFSSSSSSPTMATPIHPPSPQSSPSPSPSPPPPPPPPPHLSTHPMTTRAKSGIFKPLHRADLSHTTTLPLHQALFAISDPKIFKTASQNPQWVIAMQRELEALHRNNTWTLVPRPSNHNVVGSKWLYRTKFRPDGTIERHKARLVAQGFSQIPGLDFYHTFSPVVKASTIHVVLSLAVINQWKLHQLDVDNAFLHGRLNERVYMEQPPGFANPQFPNHVCQLNKALYGLKQASRQWFHRLSMFLTDNGFVGSRADTSLFVFQRDSCVMYLLVYVDDLILTGNQPHVITSFITRLKKEFAIKDLGELNYFLGLEVTHTFFKSIKVHTRYTNSHKDVGC